MTKNYPIMNNSLPYLGNINKDLIAETCVKWSFYQDACVFLKTHKLD